jgi:P-type E1-E2 ATPase
MFVDMAGNCETLICSRLSPKQKSVLVNLVRHYQPGKVVCSVGDGANDCSMLNAANVGVAICGVEGR